MPQRSSKKLEKVYIFEHPTSERRRREWGRVRTSHPRTLCPQICNKSCPYNCNNVRYTWQNGFKRDKKRGFTWVQHTFAKRKKTPIFPHFFPHQRFRGDRFFRERFHDFLAFSRILNGFATGQLHRITRKYLNYVCCFRKGRRAFVLVVGGSERPCVILAPLLVKTCVSSWRLTTLEGWGAWLPIGSSKGEIIAKNGPDMSDRTSTVVATTVMFPPVLAYVANVRTRRFRTYVPPRRESCYANMRINCEHPKVPSVQTVQPELLENPTTLKIL